MFELNNTITAELPYRLLELVGEGSMGLVYRALEPDLGRQVAIKFLHPRVAREQTATVAEEIRRRFLQEARAAAALSHPGVVTIYRIGEEFDTPYIAMEWLEGKALDVQLRDGPLAPARVMQIAAELLDALQAAHAAGVVHRDIKPSNLVVSGGGRLKVVDFGIAHLHDSDLVKTQNGMLIGTPQYASPEQVRGVQVDARSDLYSAAMVLYVLLTGKHPFAGQRMVALISSIIHTDPPDLRSVVAEVPEVLAMTIHRALAKDRERRYASAAEMAAALAGTSPQEEARVSGTDLEPTVLQSSSLRQQSAAAPAIPTLTDLPVDGIGCATAVISSWRPQPLGSQLRDKLLARLAETPLHAAAFSGAVGFSSSYLLLHHGNLVGAFDPVTGTTDEKAVEELPEQADTVLYPIPEGLPARTASLLALVLGRGAPLHRDLDSSYVNLPALSRELSTIGFDGLMRLKREDETALILFAGGRSVLQLFSTGWAEAPLDRHWESWISDLKVRADVERLEPRVLFSSYRLKLQDCALELEPSLEEGVSGSRLARSTSMLSKVLGSESVIAATGLRFDLVPSKPAAAQAEDDGSLAVQDDPIVHFLSWMTSGLPPYLAERKRAVRWKYLVEWVPLIRRAWLHHLLPRPGSRRSDLFDLVTSDGKGKVLHLAHRVAHGSLAALNRFVARVIEAKTARIKTGDVGAACLIAPAFSREAIAAYAGGRDLSGDSVWEMTISESITGYEGFVRLGPRRGFHLLLVREEGDGRFQPILPDVMPERP